MQSTMCVYVWESSGNPNSIPWNLIGRSTTTSPPVLSPSSILPPPWSYCAFVLSRNIKSTIQNATFNVFFTS